MDPLNRLLSRISPGADTPKIGEDRVAQLGFDDGLVLFVGYDAGEDRLFLYSHVGKAPEGNGEFLEELLAANLLWRDTDGATLGLERFSRSLILSRAIYQASTWEDTAVDQVVETFLNTAERWTKAVERLAEACDDSAPNPVEGPAASAIAV